MKNKVCVLGSINLDTTLHVERIPLPSETVPVSDKSSAPGGKGANQAVASARSGAKVHFIGAIGDDNSGQTMLRSLKEDNIDLTNITKSDKAGTGTATIMLDENGQNSILVYPGANKEINLTQIKNAESLIASMDFIVAQFETPIKETTLAFQIAHKHGVVTVLNPAPASHIPDELLGETDIIAPNETESFAITGIKADSLSSMNKSANYFRDKGVKATLITLGDKGVYYSYDKQAKIVPAYKVKAVDTTAAGDTFLGALSAVLKKDLSNLEVAIDYGEKASSLTVQRNGAQPSIPTFSQINKFYGGEK